MEKSKGLTPADKIHAFIKDNNINLNTLSVSALNSDFTILSGYALYIGIDCYEDLQTILEVYISKKERKVYDSLQKVFSYAKYHDYEEFWRTKEAKKIYKF